MGRATLRSKVEIMICADDVNYLTATLWEEELKKKGHDVDFSLKGTVNYDGKNLAILSYLQLYNRDRKAQYLQELKKLISLEIFRKIKNSSSVIFIISNLIPISSFLFVQILYASLLEIPISFTSSINQNDQFYDVIDCFVDLHKITANLENFPSLLGGNHEM